MELQLSCSILIIMNFILEIDQCSIEQVVREALERELERTVKKTDSSDILDIKSDGHHPYMSAPDNLELQTNQKCSKSQHTAKESNVKSKRCSCHGKTTNSQYCSSKSEKNEPSALEQSQWEEKNADDLYKYDKSNFSDAQAASSLKTKSSNIQNLTSPVSYEESKVGVMELEYQSESAIRKLCPKYKDILPLDIGKMADVWQLTYHKSGNTLPCFKIYLKQTTAQARRRNQEKYSTFNDTINWKACYLELQSTGRLKEGVRHFLQATKRDLGILDNIVISEVLKNDDKIITLQEQNPDQWLVIEDLLLMRDCNGGDVVIFSRLLSKPDQKKLEFALNLFGEDGLNGTVPCDNTQKKYSDDTSFVNRKYQILS